MIGQSVDNNNIQIKVLGFGQHISMGLNRGKVTDLVKLSHAISKAVEKAEEMAGFRVSNLNCNISGGSPFSEITTNNLQIDNEFIKKHDILKLLNDNKYKDKYQQYVPLSRTPKAFKIDHDFEVDNPVGLKSKSLTLDAINTFVDRDVLTNINKTVELSHLNINKFYITPELTGISTMIREERHHGAIIIDIGASLTSIGVYLKDNLVFHPYPLEKLVIELAVLDHSIFLFLILLLLNHLLIVLNHQCY